MIRLKESVDESVLERYGFEKRFVRDWDIKLRCVFYRTVYSYKFYKVFSGNFQSVDVYIEPFINVYGEVVYGSREVVANQHAFVVDKAVDLIAKLILAGIFEYVDSEVAV